MFNRILIWLRQFDWASIFGSALLLVLALWLLAHNPSNENDPNSYQGPFQRIVGMLSPEGWTALGTILLAAFTILLAFATIRAANAAKAAADALPALERAYLFVTMTRPVEKITSYRDIISAAYFITNVGRTPAIILKASCLIDVCTTPQEIRYRNAGPNEWVIPAQTIGEPDPDDYSRNLLGLFLDGEEVAPDLEDDVYHFRLFRLDKERIDSLRAGDKAVWVRCELIYNDVFGNEHVTARLHKLNPTNGMFEIFGGEEWNLRT